jgi:cysteine synthase A
VKGYKLVLVMPESMSIERRKLMAAYGATFDLTPREKGMKGAIERANELVASTTNAWMPNQFANEANIRAHALTTAREILTDFPDGVDYLITGVGTGGHITACSEVLKQRWPAMQTFAVEPTKSAVISGGVPGPHRIQGVGPGFIPDNLHRDTLDGTIQVTEEAAFEYTQRSAREEGILVGISSGASLAAVAQQIPDMPDGARVLTFCYDTGERYLSIEGLFPA